MFLLEEYEVCLFDTVFLQVFEEPEQKEGWVTGVINFLFRVKL